MAHAAPRTVPTRAYAKREFERFLRAIGFNEGTRDGHEKLAAIIGEMRKTARARGMSQYEIETTYDAESLLDIYRETLKRRH